MWQLRKLSTNEALSEAGPLPNNWGPIFGLHGFLEKIGDLSWVGPTYADKGWVELTDVEQTQIKMKGVTSRKNQEEAFVAQKLKDLSLTVEQKAKWVEYLLSLDLVSLQADAAHNPRFPSRPNA
tara:strand:- start:846 stop:1217 length:372 start_codon:yes stop_codon:yes gene_type:complete